MEAGMDYYVWRVRGKPVEVRLNLPMLRYMVPWIRDPALHSVEAFGLLLGNMKRRWGRYIVSVQDFEPFDPVKLSGRPQAPRGTDLNVVGLYRRRQGEELKLDRLDASFIRSAFTHAGMVYLLVAAAPAGPDRASFFIQEHGDVHGYTNYGEFPFDPEYLSSPAIDSGRTRRRWIPVAGLAACLFALGSWFLWLRQDSTVPPAAPPPPPQAQTVKPPTEAEKASKVPARSSSQPAAKHRAAKKHRKGR